MDKKEATKFKGKIIAALRKLTYTNPERKRAFDKAKVDSATHECQMCGIFCYGGTSEKNYQAMCEKHAHKKVIKEKAVADHIEPVLPLEGFPNKEWDWDVYINRMHFCGEENYQIICKNCHDKKTKQENEERRRWKKEYQK